jgi:hypothetical protein
MPTITFPPGLISLEVLTDRGLRVVVEELPGTGAPGDNRYELSWEVVVGFLVRGDPFPVDGPTSETLMNVGSASPFLSMIREVSHADPGYIAAMHGPATTPTEMIHWQITTTAASIDVAALRAPIVRKLASGE